MKKFLPSRCREALVLWVLVQSAAAAVSLSVSPASVEMNSTVELILRVGGLASGEEVVFERFVDFNANGAVEPDEPLIQRFSVRDNQTIAIGGVAAGFLPRDVDAAASQIETKLNLAAASKTQRSAGKFVFRVTGASGTALAAFTVVQPALPQSIRGLVTSGGAPVAGALVGLLEANQDPEFLGGTLTDSGGNFSFNVQPGAYLLLPFKPGFVASLARAGFAQVAANQTVTVNLALEPAAGPSITGRFFDKTTGAGVFVGEVIMFSESQEAAVGFTDVGGNFRFNLPAGRWELEGLSLPFLGYVPDDGDFQFDTSAGNANAEIPLNPATAMIYGKISVLPGGDPPGAPVRFRASKSNANIEIDDFFSDSQGNYSIGVTPGAWSVEPSSEQAPQLRNYIVSRSDLVTVFAGQAARVDFAVQSATRKIRGTVKDGNGNPISGVNVFATAFLSGQNFNTRGDTDAQGDFELPAIDGVWNAGVSNEDLAERGLATIPNQTVTIAGADVTIQFVASAPSAHIRGRVLDDAGAPVGSILVFAIGQQEGQFAQAETDSDGNFDLGVSGGNWALQLNTDDAAARGLVTPFVNVNVAPNGSVNGLLITARRAQFRIRGTVRDASGAPIPGVSVFADLVLDGIWYHGNVRTGSDGGFSLPVFSYSATPWNVGVVASDLRVRGYSEPPPNQFVVINNADAAASFVVGAQAAPPVLSAVVVLPDRTVRFQVHDSTTRTILIEGSTDLRSWAPLLQRNSPGGPFEYTDTLAPTLPRRFYRVSRL